jgi:gliding motility-associated-like protein
MKFTGKIIFIRMLLCILITTGVAATVSARHIVGGEVYYECLGPGSMPNTRNFRIIMKVYRDCVGNGAEFDNPARFGLYTYINGVYAFRQSFARQHGFVSRVTAVESPCLILPPNVCVEETTYSFIIEDLPLIEGSYIVSWQRCCRNNTINNIVEPHNTGATYTVEITQEAQRVLNNGPQFNEFPPIGICINDPINFDHSATDPEGDELVYEFCAPLQGGGPLGTTDPGQQFLCEGILPAPNNCLPPYEDVVFLAPTYSAASPLGVSSSISINPSTGFISGTPRLTGQFVVGICIKEFRNGELLSVVRRDFQFNVVACESAVDAVVKADAVVNQEEFVINSCGQNTVNFINESQIEQFIDSYRWTFDVDGSPMQASTRHASFTFPGVGSYEGMMVINEGQQCGDTAYLKVNVFPTVTAEFDFEYDTCIGGPVSFRDMSSTLAANLTDWDWDFGDQEASVVRNPNHLYQTPGVHPVSLIVTDNNECMDTVMHSISYFPVPPLIVIKPTTYLACVPEQVFFNNLSVPIDETYDIHWDFGDGGTSDQISPTHEYTVEGIYTVKVEITSPIGCYTEETFPNLITMEASPVANFSISPEIINSIESTATFTDLSTGSVGWYWDFDGQGRSFAQHPVFTFLDTGITHITQVVFHPNGCTDTLVKTIDIEPIVQFFLPNAFTPNYDGKNEIYKPVGLSEGLTHYTLGIWTRWGEQVFQTSNPEDGWNGQKDNSGKELPVGVYLCVLQYHDARGRVRELKEFVTLVR